MLDAIEQSQNISRNYDVMPDGTRLLVLVPDAESDVDSQLVEIVLHWTDVLERAVPVP